jgi:hypothetical protein
MLGRLVLIHIQAEETRIENAKARYARTNQADQERRVNDVEKTEDWQGQQAHHCLDFTLLESLNSQQPGTRSPPDHT